MAGLLDETGQFLGFGGAGQQPVQQPVQQFAPQQIPQQPVAPQQIPQQQAAPTYQEMLEAEQLRRLQQPAPAPAPGFEGKTPAGSIPRIMVDVSNKFATGAPITQQDALRYNIARDRAAIPTQAFRNGVLTTTPGMTPEALARHPTAEQVFGRVGQSDQSLFSGDPLVQDAGVSTSDNLLPGQLQAAPMPTPLGATPPAVTPQPPAVAQPQPPAVTPQPPAVAQPQPQPQPQPTTVDYVGQSYADAVADRMPNLPRPQMVSVTGPNGATMQVIDPAFTKQRELETAGVQKRIDEVESTRAALNSVEQLFELSKTTPTGAVEAFTLPFRNAVLSFFPDLVDRDIVARQQMFDALQTRMVPVNRAGTPGQVSNIEFQAYKTASAALGNTPGANIILAGGLLQARRRTEALTQYVAKAVAANPGLTSIEAAKAFERKIEAGMKAHPGFIVEGKGGTTFPVLNAEMKSNGEFALGEGARAAYASLPPDTLFRGADNKMYMKGNPHTDPFDPNYVGRRA